jgi:uncharacterized membrane protein
MVLNQWTTILGTITQYLASGVEGCAALLIALAALQATIRAVIQFFRRSQTATQPEHPTTEDIRLRLGRWLALALEFELGADILRTAIAPTWMEIGQLAAIATIRTLLNYFLQQEIDRAARRQQGILPAQQPQVQQQDSQNTQHPQTTPTMADRVRDALR